jgi:hypothetical protein
MLSLMSAEPVCDLKDWLRTVKQSKHETVIHIGTILVHIDSDLVVITVKFNVY